MKSVLLLPALLIGSGLVLGQNPEHRQTSDLKKINWLNGKWTRTNNKPGRTGQEQWARLSESEWRGFGVSLKGVDTVFVEKLKIIFKDSDIFYVADLVENREPTYFRFTEITDHSFICENPEHDFPKKIVYEKTASGMKATISGDRKSTEYFFEKE